MRDLLESSPAWAVDVVLLAMAVCALVRALATAFTKVSPEIREWVRLINSWNDADG